MGFHSDKVAGMVSRFYAEAAKKRYEHIANTIEQTLGIDDVAILIIQEGHQIQFPPDVEVFMVAPPALNEVNRWLRERQAKADQEGQSPTSGPEPPDPSAAG
jgi:hypothetical protein